MMFSRSTFIAVTAAAVTAVVTAASSDVAADCPYHADAEIWTLELVAVTVDGETNESWDDYIDLEFGLEASISGLYYVIDDASTGEEESAYFRDHVDIPGTLEAFLAGGDQ